MWTRTPLGVVLGAAAALSLGSNVILVCPDSRSCAFLISFIAGFFVLAGIQTWVFCVPRLRSVWWIAPLLMSSLALNAWIVWGGP